MNAVTNENTKLKSRIMILEVSVYTIVEISREVTYGC
jgi:hypothetical protein